LNLNDDRVLCCLFGLICLAAAKKNCLEIYLILEKKIMGTISPTI